MTAFRHSAESLATLASPAEQRLSDRIADQLRRSTNTNPSPAERRSWDRSLPVLARDLVDAGLGGVEMLVEYQLPLTSRRADVVLAGADHTGRDAYMVVELGAAEIKESEQFVLLAEQRLAYELVLHAVEAARRADTKEVVIVTGGPGRAGRRCTRQAPPRSRPPSATTSAKAPGASSRCSSTSTAS